MIIARFPAIVGIIMALIQCLVGSLPASAQQSGSKSVAPTRFLGKSFPVCAKVLGKSVAVKNPNVDYGAFSRYHRSPNRNIVCIVLSTDNDAAVECVTYQFPKGKYTPISACALLGVKAKVRKAGGELHVVSNKFAAEWERAMPDGTHPKHDWLTFFAL